MVKMQYPVTVQSECILAYHIDRQTDFHTLNSKPNVWFLKAMIIVVILQDTLFGMCKTFWQFIYQDWKVQQAKYLKLSLLMMSWKPFRNDRGFLK